MRWVDDAQREPSAFAAGEGAWTPGLERYVGVARMVGALSLVERASLLSFVGAGASFGGLRREFPGVTAGAMRAALASLTSVGWLESLGAPGAREGVRVCPAGVLDLAQHVEEVLPGLAAASIWGLERLRFEVVALLDPLAWRVLALGSRGVEGHAMLVAATGAPPGAVWRAIERLRAGTLLRGPVVTKAPSHLLALLETLLR